MSSKDWFDVKVIGVELIKGQNIARKEVHYSAYSSKTEYIYDKPTETAPKKTLVLYTANGELKTKEFKGTWTLEEVSNWNKERFKDED